MRAIIIFSLCLLLWTADLSGQIVTHHGREKYELLILLAYLNDPELLSAIQISKQQQEELSAIRRSIDSAILRPPEEQELVFYGGRERINRILLPFQIERLEIHELRSKYGVSGLDAGILYPELKGKLDVSGGQVEAILKNVEQHEKKILEFLQKKSDEAVRLRREAFSEIRKVLNADQRGRLDKLVGEIDVVEFSDDEFNATAKSVQWQVEIIRYRAQSINKTKH